MYSIETPVILHRAIRFTYLYLTCEEITVYKAFHYGYVDDPVRKMLHLCYAYWHRHYYYLVNMAYDFRESME